MYHIILIIIVNNMKNDFFISRLDFSKFTAEGEKQLQQAAEERKSYPDFVALSLSIMYSYR